MKFLLIIFLGACSTSIALRTPAQVFNCVEATETLVNTDSWRNDLYVQSLSEAKNVLSRYDKFLKRTWRSPGFKIDDTPHNINGKEYVAFWQLGQGSHATVYLAYDGEKIVALKSYPSSSSDAYKVDILLSDFLSKKNIPVAKVLATSQNGLIVKEFIPGPSILDFDKTDPFYGDVFNRFEKLREQLGDLQKTPEFKSLGSEMNWFLTFDLDLFYDSANNARFVNGQWYVVDP